MKHILANKILIIFILTVTMFISLSTSATYATTMDGIISSADNFINIEDENSTINETELKETSNTIYNVLFSIAVVSAFAVGMIIGIQFITASVDEKAKIKETLVPYVIGVFIIFSAFTIWKIAINIGNSLTEGRATHTYYTTTVKGYFCNSCGKELSETEKNSGECSSCGSKDITRQSEKYYCSNCYGELTETEKRNRICSDCGTTIQ